MLTFRFTFLWFKKVSWNTEDWEVFQKLKSSWAWHGVVGEALGRTVAPAPPGPQVRAHLPGKVGPLPCWTRGPMLALKCPCAHRFGKKTRGLWVLGSVSQRRWLTPRCALLQIEQRKYHILNDLLTDTICFLSRLFLRCGSCHILSSHTFPPIKKISILFLHPFFFFHLLSSHPFSNEIKDSHLATGDL